MDVSGDVERRLGSGRKNQGRLMVPTISRGRQLFPFIVRAGTLFPLLVARYPFSSGRRGSAGCSGRGPWAVALGNRCSPLHITPRCLVAVKPRRLLPHIIPWGDHFCLSFINCFLSGNRPSIPCRKQQDLSNRSNQLTHQHLILPHAISTKRFYLFPMTQKTEKRPVRVANCSGYHGAWSNPDYLHR